MYCSLNSVYFGQLSLVSYVIHLRCLVQLFKMEDVSMGMWVEGFNASSCVQYSHNWTFCQYGCTNDYYTAHYKSPRQMLCMWDKLLKGKVECCYL